jgi:hypothetical protein
MSLRRWWAARKAREDAERERTRLAGEQRRDQAKQEVDAFIARGYHRIPVDGDLAWYLAATYRARGYRDASVEHMTQSDGSGFDSDYYYLTL